MGILDLHRSNLLVTARHRFEQTLANKTSANDLKTFVQKTGAKPYGPAMLNVSQLRSFLGSQGEVAMFDIPWMPVYFSTTILIKMPEFLSPDLNTDPNSSFGFFAAQIRLNDKDQDKLAALGLALLPGVQANVLIATGE